MEDYNLIQSDAQIQGILNAIQPFYTAGDLNALGFGYGDCTTAGSTAAKTVAIANTIITKGGCISVNFQNAFTVANATLSVNGSTAYPIRLYGSAIPMYKVRNNTILTMRFDGSYFNVIAIESQFKAPSDAVDLGLPSGLLWCSHNVGANSPEASGNYFSWGNVKGYAEGGGYNFNLTNYKNTNGYSLTGDIPVGNTYDGARKNQGNPWRMPTTTEAEELKNNCTVEWLEQNNVMGYRLTSKINGVSIFMPASGHYNESTLSYKGTFGFYWNSSYYNANDAYCIEFWADNFVSNINSWPRFLGMQIRPVL